MHLLASESKGRHDNAGHRQDFVSIKDGRVARVQTFVLSQSYSEGNHLRLYGQRVAAEFDNSFDRQTTICFILQLKILIFFL